MIRTIEKLKKQTILIISSNGTTPHLETSIEILERLKKENTVNFLHLGNHLTRPTLSPSNIIKREFQLKKRIKRAELYIKNIKKEYKCNWIKVYINKRKIADEIRCFFKKNNDLNINSLEKLQELNFKDYNIGLGISSTMISKLRNPNPFPLTIFEKIELKEQIKTSITSILISENIISNQYDSIILFNGRFSSEHAIKQLAIAKKLKIYYYECGAPYPIGRYFFEEYMPHNFEKRKTEMNNIQQHISQDLINETGTYFFNQKTNG